MKIVTILIILTVLIILYYYSKSSMRVNPFQTIKNDFIKYRHYIGVVPLNIEVCKENLLLFDDIMKKHGIFYWLSEGTALGVVRDNSFIPWDDDVDISFKHHHKQTFYDNVLPELKDNGFVLGRIIHNDNFITVHRKNEKIDIDIVQENGECMANNTKNAGYSKKCNDLLKYLNMNTVLFLDRSFNVPQEEYLEYLYGADWKTPKKSK